MEKRDNKIFMLSPGHQNLAMAGKLLHRATIINGRIDFILLSKTKKVLHRQKARIHFLMECGHTFCVICEVYQIIYQQELLANTWPGENKCFLI